MHQLKLDARESVNDDAKLLAGLLASMPSAMLLMDRDGKVRRTNDRLGAIFGLTPPLPGTPLAAWLRGVAMAGRLSEADLERPFIGSGGRSTWRLADGRSLALAVHALPDGDRLCLWTETLIETELAEERTSLRQMLASITDSVVLMDADGVILQNSKSSGALLDLPDEFARPGARHDDILRYFYRRGDFGFEQDEDSFVAERRARIIAAGNLTYAQRMPNGRWAEYNFRTLPKGQLLVLVRDVTELREALSRLEAERAEREEDRRRANALLESTQDIVVLADTAGTILESSSRGDLVFGLPGELFERGRNHRDILRLLYRHGGFETELTEEEFLDGTVARLAVPGRLQRTRRMPDGHWAEITCTTRDDGLLVISLRDVTELKQAQAALEEEEEKLRLVVENMSDGVMLFDSEMRWRMLSRPLMKFLDLPEQFYKLGTSARDVIGWQMRRGDFGPPPPDGPEFERALDGRIANLRRQGGTHYFRKTHAGFWLDVQMQPLPGGGHLAFYRDVTPIKEREERLAAERTLLREVLESMDSMVVLLDPEARIILSNGGGRNLLELPDEMVRPGAYMADAMRHMYRRGDFGFDVTEEEVVDGRVNAVLSGPVHLTRRTATGKWLEFNYTPISGGRVVTVGRDVTALKAEEQAALAARDAAEAASRAKANFLAAMSHEIRTPMNGVLGMLEILSHGELNADQARHVQVMRESAEGLLRIVDDLLDFSKIEAGRLEIEELPFSLRGLVEGTLETLSPAATTRGLALFADPPEPGPDWLAGDPTRVRQILFNLIGNALKFTERGYVRVSARTRQEGDAALLTIVVEDSGIGMDAETLTRLFQPFSQADTSTTRRFGGTGLGLSIVRRLAELMGGEARAESRLGRGSRFTVTLRLGLASNAAQGPRTSLPSAAMFPGATAQEGAGDVLVVDDHPVNREVIGRQLELLGLRAEMAEGGAEALRVWRAGSRSIMFLDIHMPGMDGFELARAIRQEEQARALPRTTLIAVTANALKGEAERCYAAGMDAFVTKPVTLESLSRALGRWLPGLSGAGHGGTLFDPEALRSLFGQDPDRLSAILENFARNAEQELTKLQAAQQADVVVELAHRLKGSARMVGARLLAEQAQGVELAARAGGLGAAQAAASQLPSLLAETLRVARPALGASS
ncbi:PAS-domain containing protein [Roseococcus sp. YIM B11640]|uniref:PAS-domain containing protein n=1 Tax=Roseococcus sp. YIM B11640 TaxID=3133973 RepID=UPI003C7EAB93